MKVVYILPSVGRCGGVRVVLEHASRLAARGHDAQVWHLSHRADWFGRPVNVRRFNSTDEIGQAMRELSAASIVATFWITASWVAPNLRNGSKGFYLCQDYETVYGPAEKVDESYRLGLQAITEGEWVTAELRRRFGIEPINVGIGLDHEVFHRRQIQHDPTRIFAQFRPGGGPNDLKGWEVSFKTILRACQSCCGSNRPSLVTFGQDGPPRMPASVPHIHVHAPSDGTLAELYSQAGLFLLTSKHEGFGLTAAEAMACGCPVVATFAQGNEEFCLNGETSLMGRSIEELAGHAQRLLRHPEFARELGERGRRFVQKYRWDAVIDKLEAVYDRRV